MLFDHNPGLNITKAKLKKLFEFAISGTYFLFQGKFYDQIDGVVMGSLLGPVLANLFIGYYENMWLNSFRECEFRGFLNTQHPNIKFTFEK